MSKTKNRRAQDGESLGRASSPGVTLIWPIALSVGAAGFTVYAFLIHGAFKPDFTKHLDPYNEGIRLERQERLDEAVACYAEALALKPDYVPAHIMYGNVRFKQRAFSDAEAAFREAARLCESNDEERLRPTALYNLGNVLMARNRWAAAAETYRKALGHDESHHDAWYNLGVAYGQLRQFDESVKALESALRIEPNNVETQAALQAARNRLDRPSVPRP